MLVSGMVIHPVELPGASVAFSGACTDHCFAQSTAYWTVKVGEAESPWRIKPIESDSGLRFFFNDRR